MRFLLTPSPPAWGSQRPNGVAPQPEQTLADPSTHPQVTSRAEGTGFATDLHDRQVEDLPSFPDLRVVAVFRDDV